MSTPAGEGVLGVIRSMADPAYIVRGKGKANSLRSASHGAGRRMSRSQDLKTFNWAEWKTEIKNRGVRVPQTNVRRAHASPAAFDWQGTHRATSRSAIVAGPAKSRTISQDLGREAGTF